MMKRSTVSRAITGPSCGSRMCRKVCVGAAPSTSAASSRSRGTAWSRASRKRKAKGKYRQASNAITVSSASGTSNCQPRIDTSCSRWLRNAIGRSQPRKRVPQLLAMPNWGLSMISQTNVTATTGAT
jgi:hypothetical protein